MIKEITLPSKPDAARGKDMHHIIFVGDPDMDFSHTESGKFSDIFEACLPKFTGTATGKILVYGTSGSAFGKAESPNQEEVFELFENIMIDGQ